MAANVTETKDLKNTIQNDEEQFKGEADIIIFAHYTTTAEPVTPLPSKCLN